MHTLDTIDRKIVAILQRDSRTTMQELADQVGLSVSPCHRRVKLLEERGVITRYIATVDQKSLGLHVSVSSRSSWRGRRKKTSTVSPRRSRVGRKCWSAI